jgi:hypothetical protein
MHISVVEFIAFAKATEGKIFETRKQNKPFCYKVVPKGLEIIPSTGKTRIVRNKEIRDFCQRYSENNSINSSDYNHSFNKAYLLAIVVHFDTALIDFPLAEELVNEAGLVEGASRRVLINCYERNQKARRECIEHYGVKCVVCGMTFENKYGPYASGYIHVHHVNPMATRGCEYEVDPKRDLQPVCPNCHVVIHMRGGCSIDEARRMYNK